MVSKYRINLLNGRGFYFILRPLLLIFVINTLLLYFINKAYELPQGKLEDLSLGLFLFTSFFYLLPHLILVINYGFGAKGGVLTAYENGIDFNYTSNSKDIPFSIDEILSIEVHLSVTGYEQRFKWFFWDELFYYKVILKGGAELFIPCVVCDKLEDMIDFNFNRIKRLYPIYFKSK